MKVIAIVLIALLVRELCRIRKDVNQLKEDREIVAENIIQNRQQIQKNTAERRKELLRILAVENEQRRQAQDIERIQTEQTRQAEQIRKLQFQIAEAEHDIAAAKGRINQLYALLDLAEASQAAAVPGSKADESAQRKIISLEGQITAAEKRLRAAEYKKQTAEGKLAA